MVSARRAWGGATVNANPLKNKSGVSIHATARPNVTVIPECLYRGSLFGFAGHKLKQKATLSFLWAKKEQPSPRMGKSLCAGERDFGQRPFLSLGLPPPFPGGCVSLGPSRCEARGTRRLVFTPAPWRLRGVWRAVVLPPRNRAFGPLGGRAELGLSRARVGRDPLSSVRTPSFTCFNPRARVGRDWDKNEAREASESFNPRARVGRDNRFQWLGFDG